MVAIHDDASIVFTLHKPVKTRQGLSIKKAGQATFTEDVSKDEISSSSEADWLAGWLVGWFWPQFTINLASSTTFLQQPPPPPPPGATKNNNRGNN